MKRDFTLKTYKDLLLCLRRKGYVFVRVEDYFSGNIGGERYVILRHDVDRDSVNAMVMGEIEAELGIFSTYYFRILPVSFSEVVIKKLVLLGHEIGYHYEDLALSNGDYDKAISMFEDHLEVLRKYYDVKTVCMHGSPMSRWNSLTMWDNYDYRDYGIIGEPFKDIDYNDVFYLTDTGRGWNKNKYSLRDKVETRYNYDIRDTYELINNIESNDDFPRHLMINTHTNRWYDSYFKWSKELIMQGIKNTVKMVLNKFLIKIKN